MEWAFIGGLVVVAVFLLGGRTTQEVPGGPTAATVGDGPAIQTLTQQLGASPAGLAEPKTSPASGAHIVGIGSFNALPPAPVSRITTMPKPPARIPVNIKPAPRFTLEHPTQPYGHGPAPRVSFSD